MLLSQLKCQHHRRTAPQCYDISGMLKNKRDEMDELTFVVSVVHELCPWLQIYHSWYNLQITAGVLGMSDVVVNFL